MPLYYIANIRFPTEKAHGKQTREMCNALASLGADVTLVVTNRATAGTLRESGLSGAVAVERIAVPNTVRFGRVGFLLEYVCFAWGTYRYLRRRAGGVVVTREFLCATVAVRLGAPTVWESHRPQWNMFVRYVLAHGASLLVVSKGLQAFYIAKGVSPQRIVVAPAAVDLARYKNLPTKAEARQQLGLSATAPIALYNGHLYPEKGAGTLVEAALLLPVEYRLILMGGTDQDIASFRNTYAEEKRIEIIGRKEDAVRPLYMRAADVVVLPNSAREEITEKFGSPLKLYGYMASGTPIVASDLPTTRETLDDSSAYLVLPDNAEALAAAIVKAVSDPLAEAKAAKALSTVSSNTWEHRAGVLLGIFAEKVGKV